MPESRPIAKKLASATNWTLGILGGIAFFVAQKYELTDSYCIVRPVVPVVAVAYLVLLGALIFLFQREKIIDKIAIPAGLMFIVVCLLCSQSLQIYNGLADTGEDRRMVYTVLEKQYRHNNTVGEGSTLITDRSCPLNVERRIYQTVRAGDQFTLITKKGKLGVEWIVGVATPQQTALR